jgi:hypothetical protein
MSFNDDNPKDNPLPIPQFDPCEVVQKMERPEAWPPPPPPPPPPTREQDDDQS